MRLAACARHRRSGGVCSLGRRRARQVDLERRCRARLAVDPDASRRSAARCRSTVERPRPVPLPTCLVVKNGSKMRACVVRVHADAGVGHREHARSGRARRRRCARRTRRRASTLRGLDRRACRRRGIASRALTTRFMITCSIWPGSAVHAAEVGARARSRARCPRRSAARSMLLDRRDDRRSGRATLRLRAPAGG